MESNEDKAIGIKLFIGYDKIPKGMGFEDFLKHCTVHVEQAPIYIKKQFLTLTCKWYDEDEGTLFFHFERPINKRDIKRYFKKSEIIEYIPSEHDYSISKLNLEPAIPQH